MASASQPQDTVARPNRARIVLALVISAALFGLGWGVKQWLYGRTHESTDNAQVDGHLVPVLAKVSGYVTAVTVAENDRVRSDSTLVRIDEREYGRLVAARDPLLDPDARSGFFPLYRQA